MKKKWGQKLSLSNNFERWLIRPNHPNLHNHTEASKVDEFVDAKFNSCHCRKLIRAIEELLNAYTQLAKNNRIEFMA